jgi:hypothetical protein
MPLDEHTRTLLVSTLREALTAPHPPDLRDLGWEEVLAEDPEAATTLFFVEEGRALGRTRLLDDVVLRELGLHARHRAVVYPMPGQPAAVGLLDGLVLGPLDDVDELVVPTGDSVAAVSVEEVTVEPVATLAAALDWRRVRRERPVQSSADDRWAAALAAARRALAAEIIGAASRALELAVEHTAARRQYGRTISSFQAVRHRLAEAHVACESARSVLRAAWADVEVAADGGRWAATVAKAEAGRAQTVVARHTLQVCGAIGLSQEHDLHRYVARAAVLDALLGDHRLLEAWIGTELLDGAILAPMVQLAP